MKTDLISPVNNKKMTVKIIPQPKCLAKENKSCSFLLNCSIAIEDKIPTVAFK